ncbi:MAG: ferrochelatase, partial [Gemmatimonadetes bacterium]|nr:ferrochelatase [Gemmatimonadota bacterium]
MTFAPPRQGVQEGVQGGHAYDAVLVVSFGGPEGPDDVMPFLENVLRGRNVTPARMREVARHYELFGGISPINEQNRALVAALGSELERHGLDLAVYWGNRNWHPLLADTLRAMVRDGVRRVIAFFTSAYSSYSGCRQYREDLARAQASAGGRAPHIDKLRVFYNHPGFINPSVRSLRAALGRVPAERRGTARVAFTAHSIPLAMAGQSAYARQLEEASRLVAGALGLADWRLVWQSRSGPARQPWLEPDILEHCRALRQAGAEDVVVAPIGFLSDHMEVIYDLDTEARALCEEIGLGWARAAT